MIRFVKHQDIDPKKWDLAVEKAANYSVFGTFDMLNALTGDENWHAVVKNDYEVVLPLPYRTKFGISYIYTPFFLPQMGIYAQAPVEPEDVLSFFNTVPKKFVQVDLLFNRQNNISCLPENHLTLSSHEVNLQIPYDTLFHDFSQNTKRNIKSAEKHFLTIENNEKFLGDIVSLFKNNRGKENAVHYKEQDYLKLSAAAEWLMKNNQLDVLGVRDNGQNLIAGALLVRDRQRIWFWFSGRDEKAAESKPMFFLINEFLKEKSGSDLVFDFNGSNNENVARFYRGFGGLPYSVPMLQHSRSAVLGTMKKITSKR